MADKINLKGHVADTKSAFVAKACQPLFETTDIRYFCYLRRYKDGHFTFLPTQLDPGLYFFEDGVYPDTWFAGIPFNALQSGYTYWHIAKQVSGEATQNISHTLT